MSAGLVAFAVSAVAAGSMLAVASPSSDTATRYPSCYAMRQDWPHGVGKLFAVDHVAHGGRRVTDFHLSIGIYTANKRLDGDHDGIACEKH